MRENVEKETETQMEYKASSEDEKREIGVESQSQRD